MILIECIKITSSHSTLEYHFVLNTNILYKLMTGLKLMLNIDQDEYVPQTGDTAGVRVVVHNQRTMPFPEDEVQ